MSNLQMGSLVLNTELLAALAAGIMGLLAAKSRLRKRADRDASAAWNAMILWIAVWKGSLLLTDAAGVMRQPLSLLFYDGGVVGFWLACAAAAGYLRNRFGRLYGAAEGWAVTAAFACGWGGVYLLGAIVFDSASVHYAHWLGLFAAIAAALVLADAWGMGSMLAASASSDGDRRRGHVFRRAAQGAGAALLLVLLSYTAYDQTERMLDKRAALQEGAAAVGAREGHIAPPIELSGLSGENISLAAYEGKTVLVNFWTTWCRVCMTEMPHVQKLHDDYLERGGDVAILSVNVTSQESGAEKVRQYADKRGLGFPIALDRKGETTEAYRVAAYPSTFILDGNGVIRERFLGAISYEDMKKRIERVRDRYRTEL